MPQTREQALDFLFGEGVSQDIQNRVNQLQAIVSADDPIAASKGFIPIGPPNELGTPVKIISDEIEQEYEMRRDAFVNSIGKPNISTAKEQILKEGGYQV